jgi:uncharacterized membrane protein affecting hemolysin expression
MDGNIFIAVLSSVLALSVAAVAAAWLISHSINSVEITAALAKQAAELAHSESKQIRVELRTHMDEEIKLREKSETALTKFTADNRVLHDKVLRELRKRVTNAK